MTVGFKSRLILTALLTWFTLSPDWGVAQSTNQSSSNSQAPSTSTSANDAEPHVSLRSLPKNLLEDQQAFLTTPFRMRAGNLVLPTAGNACEYPPSRQRYRS